MREQTITLYEFSELSEAIQEKLIEKHRYDYIEDDYWYKLIYEDFKNIAQKQGYSDIKPHFSLSGSQGDGACFDANIDVRYMINNHTPDLLPFIDEIDIAIRQNAYATHYCHSRTRQVELIVDYSHENYELYKLYETFEKAITADYQELCKMLEIALQTEMDDLTSDDYIREELSSSEYYADGRVYY